MLPRVFRRCLASPPSYFSNPARVPTPFNGDAPNELTRFQAPKPETPPTENPTTAVQDFQLRSQEQSNAERPIKDLTGLIAMLALSYLAFDNYVSRVKLEKIARETTAINIKTLQQQQQDFVQSRQRQLLAALKDRKDSSRRQFKMAVHIALLRQQLEDAGIAPVEIDEALSQFDKNVRMSSSLQGGGDFSIWLDDASQLKKHIPDSREYDRRGEN